MRNKRVRLSSAELCRRDGVRAVSWVPYFLAVVVRAHSFWKSAPS